MSDFSRVPAGRRAPTTMLPVTGRFYALLGAFNFRRGPIDRGPGISRPMRVAASLALAISTLLAACTALDSQLTVFADPAKYDFYNCEQLAVNERLKDPRRGTEIVDGQSRAGHRRGFCQCDRLQG